MSLEPFKQLKAVAVPIVQTNVDTDQIIPAYYLQKPRSDDFSAYLFHDLRFKKDGSENEGFVLNQKAWRQGKIIVAQANFGCGSSREHAVWALHDYGVRVVIAPSFADIFASNALKNGLLLVVLPEKMVDRLLGLLLKNPGSEVDVDLVARRIVFPDGETVNFEIDDFSRECLLNGIDEFEYTMNKMPQIEAFEQAREAAGDFF